MSARISVFEKSFLKGDNNMITDKTDTQAKPVLDSVPDGRLGLIATRSMTEFGQKVNDYLSHGERIVPAEESIPMWTVTQEILS